LRFNLGVNAEYSLTRTIVNPTKVANFVTFAHGTKVTLRNLTNIFLPARAIYLDPKFTYSAYMSGYMSGGLGRLEKRKRNMASCFLARL
jgi:hypothetical protein